jgi:hypothetical protein
LVVAQHDWQEWLDAAKNLTPEQRGALRSAIAYSTLEGWAPDPRAVELLAQFSAGTITFTEYQAIVVRESAVGWSSTRAIVDGTDQGANHFSP